MGQTDETVILPIDDAQLPHQLAKELTDLGVICKVRGKV